MTTEEKIELAERMEHLEKDLLVSSLGNFRVLRDEHGWHKRPLDALRAAHIGDPEPDPSDTELIEFCEACTEAPAMMKDGIWTIRLRTQGVFRGTTWRSCVINAIRAEREAGK